MASSNRKTAVNKTSNNKKTANVRTKGGTTRSGSVKNASTSRKTAMRSSGRSQRVTTVKQTKKQKAAELARQKQMRKEIILIVIFAFSLFLLIANFRICGIVGDVVSGFFFGIFGFGEYFFPIYLFVSAAFLISNDFNRKLVKNTAYFGVVLLLVAMLFQVFYSTDYISIKNCYTDGYTHHAGGGVIGGGIFFVIRKLLGVPGACIVMFILAVVMFILITEISVIDNLKLLWERIRYAEDDGTSEDYDGYAEDDDRYTGYETDQYDSVMPDPASRRTKPRPSMANLNVYKNRNSNRNSNTNGNRNEDGNSYGETAAAGMDSLTDHNTVNKKTAKKKTAKKQKNDRPKDFFYREDVHELQSDPRFNKDISESYDKFSNDVEKIFMADEDDAYINPVRIDDHIGGGIDDLESGNIKSNDIKADNDTADLNSRPNSRPNRSGKARSKTAVLRDKNLLQDISAQDDHAQDILTQNINKQDDLVQRDITEAANGMAVDDGEDILAGAINGNIHPESVSDYNPLEDSAFAEDTVDRKKTRQNKDQSALENKAYQEGHKYRFPTASLLELPPKTNNSNRDAHVRETAIKLKNTLETFGVNVTITNYSCGPAVTRFEMQPEQGVKVSKILNLADDIKLNLAAADIRIEAPIPGKAAIGIEVPNKENSIVAFRELIESDNFKNLKSKVAFAVGKDISGQVIATDIAKMPHLLIAGATGSGKSVCINTLIMSILYKATPEEVKLIMIDPKMVELACYNGIPHLLIPVVTDPKKAAGALNWAVMEMTRRYQLFAEHSVRNIQGYNDKVENAVIAGADGEKLPKMPQIVVIVDELADLMMVAHGEVEDAIVRLSQLARAAGIHLVIATQRPSVDVITGLIKANVPSRIAFAVSSGVDSRTILDMVGAEKLLGKGDMLFYPTGYPKPVRVQGAFVSDDEVTAVVDFLKKNNGVGTYDDDVAKSISGNGGPGATAIGGASANDKDEYFVEAGRFIIEKEKASIGMLQRTFKIGFNRAARIMDQLMAAGVVGPEEGTKARKILMSQEQFDEYIDNNL